MNIYISVCWCIYIYCKCGHVCIYKNLRVFMGNSSLCVCVRVQNKYYSDVHVLHTHWDTYIYVYIYTHTCTHSARDSWAMPTHTQEMLGYTNKYKNVNTHTHTHTHTHENIFMGSYSSMMGTATLLLHCSQRHSWEWHWPLSECLMHGEHSDFLMQVTVILKDDELLKDVTDWAQRHCHCLACVAAMSLRCMRCSHTQQDRMRYAEWNMQNEIDRMRYAYIYPHTKTPDLHGQLLVDGWRVDVYHHLLWLQHSQASWLEGACVYVCVWQQVVRVHVHVAARCVRV